MYNPLTYWKQRTDITPFDVPERASTYIWNKIQPFGSVLDFGCGNGRLAPIFTGKQVTGYDIVDRNPPYPFTKEPSDFYGVVVASKVLLHIPPDQITDTISGLKFISRRIVVWDAVGQSAPHVFDHDYSKYGEMKDVQQWDNELLFYYE